MNQVQLSTLVNHEAEIAVLGLFLANQHQIGVALRDGLRKEYFFQPSRQIIAEVILDMHAKQHTVDLITVTQRLKMEQPLIDAVQECTYCLDNALVTPGFLAHYVGLLRELYQKRMLVEIMTQAAEDITSETSATEVSSSLLMEISRVNSEGYNEVNHDTMVERMMLDLEEGACGVVPCKLEAMRRKIGGYPKGKPTIIAARPGTGKSTYMCNEIRFQLTAGYRVGVISLEMEKPELLLIMVCEELGISTFKLKRGEYDFAVRKMVEERLRAYASKPLFVCDRNMTINQIVSWIKTMATHHELDIIYLDYVQIIRGTGKLKRYDEVSLWSHMLRDVAKETGVACIPLAQIGRAAEPPSNMKAEDAWKYVPRLHNLKESGALEEDAYVAILLYPHPINAVLDGEGLHLKYIADVAKHRGGPVGHVQMVYYKDHQRFEGQQSDLKPVADHGVDMFDDGSLDESIPF